MRQCKACSIEHALTLARKKRFSLKRAMQAHLEGMSNQEAVVLILCKLVASEMDIKILTACQYNFSCFEFQGEVSFQEHDLYIIFAIQTLLFPVYGWILSF